MIGKERLAQIHLPWYNQFNRIETNAHNNLFSIAWIFWDDRMKAWIIRYDAIVAIDFLRCFHQKRINYQFVILQWLLHTRCCSAATATAVAIASALRINIPIHLSK